MPRASPNFRCLSVGRGAPKTAARLGNASGKGSTFGGRVASSSPSPSLSLQRRGPRPLTTTAVPSPSSPSADSPSTAAGNGVASFDWSANWYPVGSLLSTLDAAKPNKVTLLGRDLVVWLDGSSAEGSPPSWRAAVDECPHRLAAMSDGRLENGVLSCRYHGWEFGGERGQCSRCPQASDAEAEATVLASPRSRLRSLPCKVAQNLLFVWPQEERRGGFENAAKAPLRLIEDLDPERAAEESGGVSGSGVAGDWGFQKPPVDWLLMTENSMDPSHTPFLHEATIGPDTRQSAAPMEMRVSAGRPVSLQGFEVEHGGYTKSQQQSGMRATRSFSPPCSVFTKYSYESGPNRDKESCALIYFVPTEPGQSMIFAKFFTRRKKETEEGGEGGGEVATAKAPLTDAWRDGSATSTASSSSSKQPPKKPPLLSRLKSSLAHVLGQSLVDQDVLIMHGIYRKIMALSSSSSTSSSSPSSSRWKSSYWLATQADAGVTAFHDWVERHGGGGPWGTDLGASSSLSSTLKPLPKEELLNHWERHTKHCSVCLAALKRLERARVVVAVAGFVAAASAAAAGVVAAALLADSASSSPAASASSSSPLTVASLAQVGLPCAAAAVVLALTWTWLTAWKGRFYRADKLADEK